jgi:flagellin-like hook-associated protein FlgL
MIDSQGNATGPGPGPFIEPFHQSLPQQVPAYIVFQILSYSANAVDPDSGASIGPGVLIQFQAYSQDPAMGAAPLYTDTSAVPVNAGPIINAQYYAPISFGGGPPNLLMQFSVANLTAADVGATAAFISTVASPAATGHSLNVNDGGDEGTTIAIDLPQVNTNTLNISNLSVQAPEIVNFMNQVTGQSSSNVMAAADAETRTDTALQTIGTIRAQIGAQMVATQIDANSDDTATVQYQATVSNIRDANIGATVTDYTRQQILVSVGNSVVSQLQVSTTQLTALLLNSFSGSPI